MSSAKPKSCLTCRRRRKKCDLNKPHCDRCLKGGFECLGYGSNPRAKINQKDPHVLVSQSGSTIRTGPTQSARSETTLYSVTTGTLADGQPSNGPDMDSDMSPSVLGTGLRYMVTRPIAPETDIYPASRALEDFNHTWPQSQTQLTPYQSPIGHRSTSVKKSLEVSAVRQIDSNYMTRLIGSLCSSVPPSVVSTHTIGEAHFVHTLNEYQLQRASYFFMTPPSRVHVPMVNRLKSSHMMIWTVYLGTKLFQELNRAPGSVATKGYIGWINNLEQKFTVGHDNNSPLKDAADRLMAQLELVFLSFVAIGSPLGYDLLQKSLPVFLRLVAAIPNLIIEHPNSNLLVSFPRTFSAPQNELKRFILYDTSTALILGVPPLAEYDYDGECDPSSHGFQWVHGVPVPLVEVISQVNSWRAGSRVGPLNDWKALENRVFTWEPQPLVTEDEPRGNIARLAVQEGWRHVALIYIYMGICGVSSHDLRVQASVSQIVQLGRSVNDLSISMHMLMHYVVAGLGARYEQHRSIIREKLLSLKGKRVWLFRGPEFSQVLGHLWHGVGAGGAPVTWDDYVRSRRKKCDLTRPCCERCLKGGFQCLGYGDREPRTAISRLDPHVPVSQSRPTLPTVSVQVMRPESRPNSGAAEISKNDQHPDGITVGCDSPLSTLGTGLRYEMSKPISDDHDTTHSLEDFNRAWPHDQNHIISHRHPPLHRAASSGTWLEKVSVRRSTRNRVMQSLRTSIPPSVVSPQTIGEARFIHMINDYQLYRVSCWFTPPPPGVRGPMIDWLRSSRMMVQAVYLGLNLFTVLNQDSCDTPINSYIGWIDKLEQRIMVSSNENSPARDTANRLAAQLELTFIGFVSIGVSLGYALLRNALPGFLRVVAADSKLVVEHPNGSLLVSFPRILSVPQQELNLFILYDAATAFALGVPSLVEYDHDGECDPTFHGHQCAHGVPVPLVEIISQVNSWRSGSKVHLDDWKTLESRALAWQGHSLPIEDEDPSVNVARLAVQESWRHVTLVYLYMGMCGVSSHDSRVQSSVSQIVQLEERVSDISISMHMLMHYVIVGLGAQHEQERSIVRERLMSLKGKRVWLFRGPEFSRVLDHLWCGVGVGGAPVTWDDYIRSRRAVLPL